MSKDNIHASNDSFDINKEARGGSRLFDSIEIQPSQNNFGTISKRNRPSVMDLTMGNLQKHFQCLFCIVLFQLHIR